MAFEAMRFAAQKLGWTLAPAEPGLTDIYETVSITGTEGDVPVRLERRAIAYAFTTFGVIHPGLDVAFLITPEGLKGKIAHKLGFDDVTIGDTAFDDAYRIATEHADRLKELLTPEVKEAIGVLSRITDVAGSTFRVTQNGVFVDRMYGTNMITPEDIVYDIPYVTATVRALKSAASAQRGYR